MRTLFFVLLVELLISGCSAQSRQALKGVPTAPQPTAEEQQDVSDVLDYPAIRLDGHREGKLVLFSMSSCDEPAEPVPAIWIRVIRGKIVCEARRDFGDPPVQQWSYGQAADGFRLGTCQELTQPGRYTFCVSGGGGGCRDFDLDATGRIEWVGSPCGQH